MALPVSEFFEIESGHGAGPNAPAPRMAIREGRSEYVSGPCRLCRRARGVETARLIASFVGPGAGLTRAQGLTDYRPGEVRTDKWSRISARRATRPSVRTERFGGASTSASNDRTSFGASRRPSTAVRQALCRCRARPTVSTASSTVEDADRRNGLPTNFAREASTGNHGGGLVRADPTMQRSHAELRLSQEANAPERRANSLLSDAALTSPCSSVVRGCSAFRKNAKPAPTDRWAPDSRSTLGWQSLASPPGLRPIR